MPLIKPGHPAYRPPKASDAELIAVYKETASVWQVAERFGMCGQSVHERLQKLRAMTPKNIWTGAQDDRLRDEYGIAATTGKVGELAEDLGRTMRAVNIRASRLGLGDRKRPKIHKAKWKYMGEESARIIFEQFKQARFDMKQFCARRGFDNGGFSNCMKRHFPDEWEHVIEAKQYKQTMYRIGRQFEYRVRDHLKSLGYFALRSPASRSPIDLVAIRMGVVLLIQCKRGGALPPKEWNALLDIATGCGAVSILATSPTGRGVTYHRLLGQKDGSKRLQPYEAFNPEYGGIAP